MPLHPGYPSRLRSLSRPPATLWTCGGSLEAERVVAIVGSRDPAADALEFAKKLAGTIARAGGLVVSGGAAGVDAAAHRGAMAVGGRTWVVASTAPGRGPRLQQGPLRGGRSARAP